MDLELEVENVAGLRNRIGEHREAAGLNKKQLADLMGIDRGTLSRLERGEMKLTAEYLEKLSAALDRHPVEFITDADVARSDAEREALETLRGMSEEALAAWLATGKQLRRR